MDMREINKGIVSEFRSNDGELSGPMAGAPLLLLTTTGRNTGDAHTTPLGYAASDGRLAVAAANGGADHNPDWYQNIEGNDQVTVEVPGSSISAVATIASDTERLELLQLLSESLPGMADHISATRREIPVVTFEQAN